jgi:hypothetical protein
LGSVVELTPTAGYTVRLNVCDAVLLAESVTLIVTLAAVSDDDGEPVIAPPEESESPAALSAVPELTLYV